MVLVNIRSNDDVPEEVREITRLKFVLDQSNRYPDLLDVQQMKKFSLRLNDLERKMRM